MSEFENINKTDKCRITGKTTTITIRYKNDHHLDPKYHKQRMKIEDCPNGGCNNCPIYKSMPDEKIF